MGIFFIVEKTWKNKALQGLTYLDEWEFQDPKLEVPTIYKAYFSGLNFREYPNKIWSYIPHAPWCWNIYLHLSHFWGKCR